MMNIDEAISHCKDVALRCEETQRECALEHVQLMDWLKELKCLRKVVDKKYLDGISILKKAFGEEYDRCFEIELRRDLSGMFAEPKSIGELAEIFKGIEPEQLMK